MYTPSNTGAKAFTEVESFQLNQYSDNDITISQADGTELAVIYSNCLESRYLIFDVSQYPSEGECDDGTRVMEVLYKLPLRRMENDNDSFPLPDYDTIIAKKTLQLLAEGQEGKEERVKLMHNKVDLLLSRKIKHKAVGVLWTARFSKPSLMTVLEDSAPYVEDPWKALHR